MTLPQRRKLEGKTDYRKRRLLLQGNRPRFILRKTNRYLVLQYATSEEAQDNIKFSASSRELLGYGWPKEAQGSLKSIPAAYLTGFLAGKELGKRPKETIPIIDKGMIRNVYKSKIFACIKGLQDSGIPILSKKEEVYPEEKKLYGEHLKSAVPINIQKIKQTISERNAP